MAEFDQLMYEISRPDYKPISGYKDLNRFLAGKIFKTRDGSYSVSWPMFVYFQGRVMRLGQAFMNVLPDTEYEKLTATPIDPFYKNEWNDVYRALDYLILSE